MSNKKIGGTFRLALLGVLSAIITMQTFVPFLGYLPTQPFVIVIIHVTVIIGAVLLGPLEGAILGGVWGFWTLVRAFILPTSPIDPIIFTNPIISVLPRVLIGIFAGLVYRAMKRSFSDIPSAMMAGIVGSLTNTVLVLGFIYLFYRVPYANFYQMDVSKLLPAMLVVVGTNGVAEAIAAAILTPAITKPLLIIRNKRP